MRVNGYSSGTAEEQMKLVADGMRKLVEYADPLGINIVIENHGGLSSNAKWLVQTIKLGEPPARRHAAGFRQFPHQPARAAANPDVEDRELRLLRRRRPR